MDCDVYCFSVFVIHTRTYRVSYRGGSEVLEIRLGFPQVERKGNDTIERGGKASAHFVLARTHYERDCGQDV